MEFLVPLVAIFKGKKMSNTAKRVLAVWASLTPAEREDAITLINDYQSADDKRKKEIALESINDSRSIAKSTTMNWWW